MTKRIICAVLAAALLITAALSVTVSGESCIMGDADFNLSINVFDASHIQKGLTGTEGYPDYSAIDHDSAEYKVADVDGNGAVNIFDAAIVLKWLVHDSSAMKYPIGQEIQIGDGPSTDPDCEVTKVKNEIKVYFSNNKNWNTVNAYIYNNATGDHLSDWPGTAMQLSGVNNYGEQIYTLTADVSKYDRIIFNNGTNQTTDTPLTKASSGYYIAETLKTSDHKTKYIVGVYPYGNDSDIAPVSVTMNYPDGYEKPVYIWLPKGYDPADKSKKYSVLYMCDGQNLFGGQPGGSANEWECDESVLSLMGNGGDGVIVVGIACGSTGELRNHELTPDLGELSAIVGASGDSRSSYENGGGKVFSDFVVNEVIPYVESNYNTNSLRGVAGSSSGGIEAFYIGMEHPDKFSYIGALSPAFILYDKAVWDDYLSSKDFSGKTPRIYFFCGNSSKDQLEQALYTNATAMEGWMKEHGYPADKMITIKDQDAYHNEIFWALYFPEMLSWCLDV